MGGIAARISCAPFLSETDERQGLREVGEIGIAVETVDDLHRVMRAAFVGAIEHLVERLDQLLKLSPEQKERARDILWNELAEQLAAVPEGGELQGFLWREPTRDLLRALFTPEQLATYNSTPTGQGGGGKTKGPAAKGY